MTRRCFVPAAPVLRFFYLKTRRLTIWDPRGNKLISMSPSDDTFVTLTARIRLMKNMTTSQTLSYVGDIIRARASCGKSRFIDGAAADGSPPPAAKHGSLQHHALQPYLQHLQPSRPFLISPNECWYFWKFMGEYFTRNGWYCELLFQERGLILFSTLLR